MKNFLTIPVMALTLGMLGCASNGQVHKLESTSETNTRLLRENEQRLKNLETSVSSLNSQMAQLNNRVYEVRNRNGKKTSLTVVPIVPPTQAPGVPPATTAVAPAATPQTPAATAAAPAAGSAPVIGATHPNSRAEALLASARKAAAARNQAAQGAPAAAAAGTQSAAATPPIGRMIDPAAAPTPIPAPVAAPRAARAQTERGQAERTVGATGSVGHPEAVAGPSGTLAAQSATAPAALPPVDLPPAAQAPATTGTQAAPAKSASAATGAAVPVPAIPASSLALPPEHPDLPPVGQPQPAASAATPQTAAVPVQAATPAPAPRAASPRGEEAAYKAALNATLAGRTNEGIRLFRDFLQQYPDGRYATNAEYWIGECLYAQGKYQDALAQFQGVNTAHPRHHKNADALLKAGMTLSRLGDKAGAAEKYRALMTQFPNSDAARRARAMGVVR